MILIVLGVVVAIGFVVFFVFSRELRRETKRRERSHHDTAFGKDRHVTAAAEDAALGHRLGGNSAD